jgi:pimeloyl-ACP methyl ester carboxylesterase
VSTPTRSQAPSRLVQFTDAARAMAEYGAFLGSVPLLPLLPRGDGHAVLVLPGLASSDAATVTLRRVLRGLGYRTYGWGLGRNIGPTAEALEGMRAKLDALHAQHGPVTIIGWSLGGIFARRLARQYPDKVRQVITMGSPFHLQQAGDSRAHPVYRWHAHRHAETWEFPLEYGEGPLPVPTTSVYSRLDGIVSWRACLNEPSPYAENVEVVSAHLGLGHHPSVLAVVADRLAQPSGTWEPFTWRRVCRRSPAA